MAESGSRLAPELLRYVDDYIEETALGEALDADLDPSSNLLAFCRGAFDQVFANVIGVPAKPPSSMSAVETRTLLRRRKRRWSSELTALVARFQHFCKIYPDVTGEEYGGGSEAMAVFFLDFVPGLMVDLEAWANTEAETDLAAALDRSREQYDAWVKQFYDDLAQRHADEA